MGAMKDQDRDKLEQAIRKGWVSGSTWAPCGKRAVLFVRWPSKSTTYNKDQFNATLEDESVIVAALRNQLNKRLKRDIWPVRSHAHKWIIYMATEQQHGTPIAEGFTELTAYLAALQASFLQT